MKNDNDNEKSECWVRICLLVECKRSTDKPWVIFTSPVNAYGATVRELPVKGLKEPNKRINDWKADHKQLLEALEKEHPFAKLQKRGRSYFEPFKTKESGDTIFKALTSTVKASIDARDNSFAAGHSSICFYYPIIVFDGKLFEASLDEKDEVVLSEAETIVVSFHYTSPKYKDEKFTVPIINFCALQPFCKSLDIVLTMYADVLRRHPSVFA